MQNIVSIPVKSDESKMRSFVFSVILPARSTLLLFIDANCLRLNRKRSFLLKVLTRTERFSENIVGLYYSEDIASACETQLTSHVKIGEKSWSMKLSN